MTEEELPKWSEVCDLVDRGKTLNSIEIFIYENEPPGLALQFRKQLLDLINWVSSGRMDRQNVPINNDASGQNLPGPSSAENRGDELHTDSDLVSGISDILPSYEG